jgi:hypothetical protein
VLTIRYRITNTGSRRGAEASQVYVTLPPVANEPAKRLVGFQKVNLDPGASQLVAATVDSSASNHPLSYFQPDANGTWAHGNWITPSGNYTVHVGSSSANTPLQAAVNLNVVALPFRLQIVPGTINLRGAAGRVTAVLSVPAPYSLVDASSLALSSISLSCPAQLEGACGYCASAQLAQHRPSAYQSGF